MSYRLSRLLSAGTAAYGAYALSQPAHLWQVLGADRKERSGIELLARVYGVRDLVVSGVGVFGRSSGAVRAAMLMRIAMDLGDAALLAPRAEGRGRRTVLVAALGWAGLNTVGLLVDSARDRR